MADPAREPDRPAEPDAGAEDARSQVRYLPVPVREQAVDATPVRPLERLVANPVPAALVAAGGGFLAGVTSWVLVRVLRGRQSRRPLGRALSGRRRRGERVEVTGSRSFLVDVHMLRR